jgi:ADP-ribose pyrophosphatase
MALRPWKKLNERNLAVNKWWTYRRDEYELPSGRKGEYHYVHTQGASLIVPQREDGSLILVRQYRYLCARESLEFPCGGVKPGSTYEETAAAELREEAGYKAGTMRLVGEFNPYNGITDEICRVYFASQLTHVGHHREATEEMELEMLSVPNVADRIRSGEVWDGMTLAAWVLVFPLLSRHEP